MINTDCVKIYEEEYQVHKQVSHQQVMYRVRYKVMRRVRGYLYSLIRYEVWLEVFR